MSEKTIALLGQPNSGKSTLFNGLTGSRQHVGNWPGKTVERKDGSFVHKDTTYKIIDLPGTYSLSANSDEEVVTRNYIASGQADVVCMLSVISRPEALAFLFAFFFNMPCLMALTATTQETHSMKWTVRIALYYVLTALIMATIAYHVGLVIF